MGKLNKLVLWIKDFVIKTYPVFKERYGIVIPTLWMLIIIVILVNTFYNFQNFILVGLAGLLASASVIKNIENANKLEKEKIKRDLFDRRKKVISSLFELADEINSKIMDYETLKDIHNLKNNIDDFNEKEHIEKLAPNLLNKEVHVDKVHNILNALDDSEFIFNENDLKSLLPLLQILLKYYKRISIKEIEIKEITLEKREVEEKISFYNNLLNQILEVSNEISYSLKLV